MRRRLWPWLPAVLWGALVFALSSVPGPDLPPMPVENFDKVVHALTYAVLGALCFWGLRRTTRLAGAAAVLIGAAIAAAYGVSDELHQLLTPGRSSDVMDALADAVGATVGALVMARLWSLRDRKNADPGEAKQ